MKRIIITHLVLFLCISAGVAQNIRQAAEDQRNREAQQQQAAREQQQRAVQQQQVAAQEQRQLEESRPVVTVTPDGTLLRGSTLTAKLDWLERSAESHNTYIVEVSANENIAPRTLNYRGAINITVILKGDDTNREIRLSSHGRMFTVNQNITFVLDRNIALYGHSQNTGSLVYITGGTLVMNAGASIVGNNHSASNSGGAGVHVAQGGTFTMNGGSIYNNSANNGGGVFVYGGAFISNSGNFTMNGGTISDNTASDGGGVGANGNFTMNAGLIAGNKADNSGGGVYVSGNFTMHGGTVTNNTATAYGGGVFDRGSNSINKTGGTITGYNSDPDHGNRVADHNGVLSRRGHAAYVNDNKRIEITAGLNMNLNSRTNDNWGDSPASTSTSYASASPAPNDATTESTSGAVSSMTAGNNQPALLQIYRLRKVVLFPTRYDIFLDNAVVGNSTNNWKTTITVDSYGRKTISATIGGRKAEVQINFEPGGVYYIRSDVSSKSVETGKTRTSTDKNGRTTTSKETEIQYTPILQLMEKNLGEREFNGIK